MTDAQKAADKPYPTAGKIVRMDPALDALVAADAVIEKVVDHCCQWTEGPVWVPAGYLLFADIPHNRIMKWTPPSAISVFMQPSGYTEAEPFTGREPGSNGMTLDHKGRLSVAGHAARNVWRLEKMDSSATKTILAERYQGKRLNSPNDLVYRSDGSLYFTDPPYGLNTASNTDPKKELPFNGVFRIPDAASPAPGSKPDDSKLQLLVKDVTLPNGIAFSPDEKVLYVAVSDPAKKIWMRYDVKPDGSLANGKVFYDATSETAEGSPDGMKVDRKGNIYSTGPGGLWIFSPEGKVLGRVLMPEKSANCWWGEADAKTLYITASTSVYRMRFKVAGVRP
jgi:gluconolactonase